MKLVLLSRDLMLASQVEGAANQKGWSTVSVADPENALAEVVEGDCQTLLVDLQLPGLDIVALVDQVRQSTHRDVPIVACGPHVHEPRLAAARQAGCDRVVTRGQLYRDFL